MAGILISINEEIIAIKNEDASIISIALHFPSCNNFLLDLYDKIKAKNTRIYINIKISMIIIKLMSSGANVFFEKLISVAINAIIKQIIGKIKIIHNANIVIKKLL